MSSQRFFVFSTQIKANRIFFSSQQSFKLLKVLRLRKGEKVEVFDELSEVYQVRLEVLIKDSVVGEIESQYTSLEKDSSKTAIVSLYQALPKNLKIETIIQKSTELGVSRLVFFSSDRSVVKASKISDIKVHRWRQIAIEATQQCGRVSVPIIELVKEKHLEFFRSLSKQKSEIFFLCNSGDDAKYMFNYKDDFVSFSNNINFIVGPEGGFTADELCLLEDLKFRTIKLSKHILRSETAAITVLSQWNLVSNAMS